MNELQVINGEMSMTSLEVVELINKFREEEGNEKVKEHKILLRDIRNELSALKKAGVDNEYNFVPVTYIDNKGEERPCYKMNKAGVMQMLNKESALVRYKTQQYIEALENKILEQNTPSYMISDPIKRAEQWIKEQKEKQLIEEQKKLIEEKHDNLVHNPKTYTTTEIAKELGFSSATALNKDLELKKIQYKVNGTWVLNAKFSKDDFVNIKQSELEGGRIIYNRRWTGKGRDWLVNEIYNNKN